MKIAVMGAGAVGCYFGGMLAMAGHEVTLVGRAVHVEAIAADGLLFEKGGLRHRIPLAATDGADGVDGAELVLFSVKSTDTEAAGRLMAPHLATDAAIWSLQNGVDNAGRLADVLERPVSAAVVYVAAEMAGPGHVRHHGRGELIVEPGGRNGEHAATFGAAGIPVAVSTEVAAALWTKLVVNCAYNAISAIAQLPYGVFAREPGTAALMGAVVAECAAVAAAEGVVLPVDLLAQVMAIADAMPGQYASTAQDLARGRRTEIDHLNGYVIARGAAHGVATPVNLTLHALVRLKEHELHLSPGER